MIEKHGNDERIDAAADIRVDVFIYPCSHSKILDDLQRRSANGDLDVAGFPVHAEVLLCAHSVVSLRQTAQRCASPAQCHCAPVYPLAMPYVGDRCRLVGVRSSCRGGAVEDSLYAIGLLLGRLKRLPGRLVIGLPQASNKTSTPRTPLAT